MKIDWNKDNKANARLLVSDHVMTHYVSADQLGETINIQEVAEAFTSGYDHGDNRDTYAVCYIEDLEDGEFHNFAFDGHGNFEWDTTRQG